MAMACASGKTAPEITHKKLMGIGSCVLARNSANTHSTIPESESSDTMAFSMRERNSTSVSKRICSFSEFASATDSKTSSTAVTNKITILIKLVRCLLFCFMPSPRFRLVIVY